MPAPTKVKEGQCEACHIFIGGKEEPYLELTDYREHKICSWCINLWKRREERLRRDITWKEFTTGMVNR